MKCEENFNHFNNTTKFWMTKRAWC